MVLGGVIMFGLGCGDDASETGLEVGDPEFALGLGIVDENFETNLFVVFTDDIGSGSIDLSSALEAGGTGNLHGLPGSREFYTSSRERSEITKYRIQDGFVREAGRVLLTDIGVQLFGEQMVFDGPDRGFVLDLLSGQIVELDLESMQIVDTIDASVLLDPNQPTFLTSPGEVRGDEIIFATYGTDLEQETVSDLSQIVFFNPSAGTFERRTAPCGGLSYATTVENGDIVFTSDPWVAGVHAISETQGPAPCLVRLPANSREPEPATIALNDLTGEPTGGLIPGEGSSFFVRVLDTESFPITDETSGIQLFGLQGWKTYEIDLTQPDTASPVARDSLATGGITFFEIDGTVYENRSSPDFGSTTMLRVTGPGAPAPAIRTPGVVFDILRLR
jgi:hypothetical protein